MATNRPFKLAAICYSQTEKIASKSPQNSSMFEIVAILLLVDRDISSVKFTQILIGARGIFDERETS